MDDRGPLRELRRRAPPARAPPQVKAGSEPVDFLASSVLSPEGCESQADRFSPAVRSRQEEAERMAFMFKLEHEDGTPADPPTFRTPFRTGSRETLQRAAA